MSTMIRMTEEDYATRQAKMASWITPQQPKKAPVGKKVEKLGMHKPVVKVLTEKKRSASEELLQLALRAANISGWTPEFRFDPARRWRADFAFLGPRLLVEVEGGIWSGGRHTRGQGFTDDCEKYNAMTIQGWRLLRFSTEMIATGYAVKTIREALA